MKPLSAPRCVVVLCFALTAVATGAPASVAPTEPAAEPGWLSRVASAPGKLAFWKKPAEPAPAEPTAVSTGSPKPKAGKVPASPGPKPTAPASTPNAAPAPEPEKPGFLSRLPSFPNPFARKPPPESADIPRAADTPARKPAPSAPRKAKSASNPAADQPEANGPATKPAPKPATPPARKPATHAPTTAATDPATETPKKPGFLGRLWPGGTKAGADDPAPASAPASAPATAPEKLGPVRPGRSSEVAATKPTKAASAKPAPAPPAKPSFWSRMASAVVPGKPASRAEPKPSRPGAPQIASADPTSPTFVITKDESPFYTFGPHQATPPDAYLSTGTVVTLQEKTWGWAQIQLADGRTGTIARNALRLATPADLIAAHPPSSLVAAAAPRRNASSSTYVMPPAAMPDLPTGATTPDRAAEAEELSSALLPPFAE